MLKKHFAAALAALAAGPLAAAQDASSYRHEASFMIEQTETDTIDSSVLSAGYTFYFQPIAVAGRPLAEAAFLERRGSVSFVIGRSEQEIQFPAPTYIPPFTIEGDGPLYGAGVSLRSPEFPLAFDAGVVRSDFEYDNNVGDYASNTYRASLGYFILPNALLSVDYLNLDYQEQGLVGRETFGGAFKWVGAVGHEKWLNVEASLRTDRDNQSGTYANTIASAGADFYPVNWLGLGGEFTNNSGKDDLSEGTAWLGRVSIAPVPNILVGLKFETFSGKTDAAEDSDGVGADIKVRF